MSDTPRIYVACLASYNAGKLHGTWIDCDQDADAINEEIKAMLAKSTEAPAEEFAIHDHEYFLGAKVGEYTPISEIAALAAAIEEHGEPFVKFMDNEGLDVEDASAKFEEAYQGTWNTFERFVEETASETMEIPEHLTSYIDWERMGRDWIMGGDFYTCEGEGGVYVFRNL